MKINNNVMTSRDHQDQRNATASLHTKEISREKSKSLSFSKIRFPSWLRVIVSITLLAVLVGGLDLSQSVEFLQLARLDLLALAVVAVGFDRLFAAYRWYVLLPRDNLKVSFAQVVRFIFVSGFLGFIVPGGIGAEAVRIYSLSRATSDLAMSFSSVLVERLFAVLALVLLTLLGLILSPQGLPPGFSYMAYLCLVLLTLVVAVLMTPALRNGTNALMRGRFLLPVRERLGKLYVRLDAYKNQPTLMLKALVLALLFQLQRIARVVLVAWALGIDVDVVYFVIFMPIIILATLLPISIAGFGVREAGFIYLFGLVGVAPEAAFTLGIVSSLITLSAVPVGAWLYMRQRSR